MAGRTALELEVDASRSASISPAIELLAVFCAIDVSSAFRRTRFHLARMLPVRCSMAFIVARNNGPSSDKLTSSPGFWQLTSTVAAFVPRVATVVPVIVGNNPNASSGMGSNDGDCAGPSLVSVPPSESLTRDSIDCAEGTRILIAGTSSRGDGTFELLSVLCVFCTQNVKMANGFSL